MLIYWCTRIAWQLRGPRHPKGRASGRQPVQLAVVHLLLWLHDCRISTELGAAEISRGEMAGGKLGDMVRIKGPLAAVQPLTKHRGGITLLHIPCSSFGSLFAVRLFLGLAEACIVPSFLLILSMFFTYQEQAVLMPIMWSVGNASPITSGLLSYGVLWIHTGSFSPWKWLMCKYIL